MWRNYKVFGVVAMDFVWPLWKSNLAAIITNHKVSTHFDPGIPLLGVYPEAIIKKTAKAMGKKVFIAIIFIIVKTWKPSKDPLTRKWFSKLWVCVLEFSREQDQCVCVCVCMWRSWNILQMS